MGKGREKRQGQLYRKQGGGPDSKVRGKKDWNKAERTWRLS